LTEYSHPSGDCQLSQGPCILITGTTGFVGSRLVRFLSAQFPAMELRLAVRQKPDDSHF
jgi:nucleoside-diphosphate-sugar epimerase